MSNFTVPYTFVGGTKARAEEVNANFLAVKNELNTKVDKNANGSVVVGTATESAHAVNKGQVESMLASGLVSKADNNLSNLSSAGLRKLQYIPYLFNIGNVNANGEPDLLDITDNTKVVFKVDETMPLVGAFADGTEFTRTSIPDLDISTLANGNYNLFVDESGACIPLANTIYKQKNQPLEDIEITFYQPSLSANGTLGGASFAVASSTVTNSYYSYYAVDADTTNGFMSEAGQSNLFYTLYNPIPLKVSKITILNATPGNFNGYTPTSGKVYASNNNSNWVEITSFTNSNLTKGSTWNITINNNNFYKYWKVVPLTCAYGSGTAYNQAWQMSGITLTATEIISSGLKTNDVWLDTSVKPFKSYKYDGADWTEFNYVNLPQSITVGNGVITKVYKSDVNFGENWQIDGECIILDSPSTIYSGSIKDSNSTPIEVNISNLLPDDNYRYLLYINNDIIGDGSGCSAFGLTTPLRSTYSMYCGGENVTGFGSGKRFFFSGQMVIESDRKVIVLTNPYFASNANTTFRMIGYRRLGVN